MPEKLFFSYFDRLRKTTLSFFNVVLVVVAVDEVIIVVVATAVDAIVVVVVDVDVVDGVSPLKVVTKKKLTHFRSGTNLFNFF
jgi:hypothetical protein